MSYVLTAEVSTFTVVSKSAYFKRTQSIKIVSKCSERFGVTIALAQCYLTRATAALTPQYCEP